MAHSNRAKGSPTRRPYSHGLQHTGHIAIDCTINSSVFGFHSESIPAEERAAQVLTNVSNSQKATKMTELEAKYVSLAVERNISTNSCGAGRIQD